MAQSVNRLILIGRIGRDPEMRYLQDGTAVTRLSLATDRPARAGAERETDWHQLVCWDKLAEFANQYVTRGRLVFACGRVTYRSWESRDGQRHRTAEVVASELVLLDRRPDPDAPAADAAPAEAGPTDDEPPDDVPF